MYTYVRKHTRELVTLHVCVMQVQPGWEGVPSTKGVLE